MTDEVVSDQAPEQSLSERIASKFGISDSSESVEDTAAVEPTLAEPDLFDLSWGEETFKVPMKLKDAFMKNEDYTRKTQALAEEKKGLEHIKELVQSAKMESAFTESIANEAREIGIIEAYLAQAGKTNWAEMSTDQILRTKLELDQVKERRDALKAVVSEKRGKFMDEVQTRVKEMKGKSRELATKSLSGFSEDAEKAMRAYAQAEGFTESEIENALLDPRSFKVIYKAAQFEKVQANTSKATDAVGKTLKPGAASNRMPAETVQKLNFLKAQKGAKTSGEKAANIERYLSGAFGAKTT